MACAARSRKPTPTTDDPHGSFGAFDYVLANPPFNVDDVSLSSVEKDKRFNTYGIPRNKSKGKKADAGKETVPNANYLWINLFASSLKPKGRAALVMANSASDARHWDHLYVTQTETRVSSKALDKFKNQVIPKHSVMFTSLSFGFGKMGI